jgi:hypothetical protein
MTDQAPPEWHDPIPGRHYGDEYKRPVSLAHSRLQIMAIVILGAAGVVWLLALLAFCIMLVGMA